MCITKQVNLTIQVTCRLTNYLGPNIYHCLQLQGVLSLSTDNQHQGHYTIHGYLFTSMTTYEPHREKICLWVSDQHRHKPNGLRREKTCFLHVRKAKLQISCAVTAQLISTFVFATWINPKFQVSSHLQWLYSLIYVGTGQKP